MTPDSFLVTGENSGTRIDLFLTRHYKTQSTRSAIQKWFRNGLVIVNDHPAKASYKLRSGDRIRVLSDAFVSAQPASGLAPWNFPLDVLYQDAWLVAINKPSRMIVHPGAGMQQHTVVHAALYHFPEMEIVGHPIRPGVVHRLDQETSGVLLMAKTREAYAELTAIFKNRLIRKYYRAAVYGKMRAPQGRIEKRLGRDPQDRKKISVRARKSRSAVTIFKVLKQFEFGALLDVEILTGRTHQIRVHLSSENHPILGDSKYGGGNWNRIQNANLRGKLKQAGFFGLHAFSLEFKHPFTHMPLRIEAPLPPIWEQLA